MKILLLLTISVALPHSPRKVVDTCRVVTVKNQVACHKVIVGLWPDNPNWFRGLTK